MNTHLSPRQREIIRGAAHGKTDKELSADLGISEGRIGNVWREILRKLHARTRTQAAVVFFCNKK